MIFTSEDPKYGGYNRLVPDQHHVTLYKIIGTF
jgi:hypothetical protein